jgi:hypothetical protein
MLRQHVGRATYALKYLISQGYRTSNDDERKRQLVTAFPLPSPCLFPAVAESVSCLPTSMTLALTIILTLLAFPILTYIFFVHPFALFPFLQRLLSTPVSLDKLTAQLGLTSSGDGGEDLPDEFEDEERWKGFNPSFEQQIEARQVRFATHDVPHLLDSL